VVAFDLDAIDPAAYGPLLDAREHETANRFRFERDARRYRAAHVALRIALSEVLGCDPAGLAWSSGALGKPGLAPPEPAESPRPGRSTLHFNLSHSGTHALLAWSNRYEVGVDVECVRALPEHESLAAVHYTADERCELAALPAGQRERAFFVTWTRKEAALKAVGVGLHVEPCRVHVGTSAVAGRARVPCRDRAGGSLADVSVVLHPLVIGAGAVAHVAWVIAPPVEGAPQP
jgi:4'-phosphopantetheinyl transferase